MPVALSSGHPRDPLLRSLPPESRPARAPAGTGNKAVLSVGKTGNFINNDEKLVSCSLPLGTDSKQYQ